MGEVYKGVGIVDKQTAAIKVLPANLAEEAEFRKRFEHEGKTLSQLHHPNIVKLYEWGNSDGVYYLAMEHIEGEELADIIKASQQAKPLDYEDIREWVNNVAAALDYAHTRGLVHRDLKPSNIMIRLKADQEIHEAILMDFGVARLDDGSTRLTGTGTIGTIDYMAPEQVMAAREVDHRADIYALGLVLYEMLTGERAFKGSPAQVIFAHLQQPAPDPRDVREDVPRSMAKATLKALEKKPEDRFQSAGELAAALGITVS
jgi:serine/threonine-protein kinase